jgi:hypothetical protein
MTASRNNSKEQGNISDINIGLQEILVMAKEIERLTNNEGKQFTKS